MNTLQVEIPLSPKDADTIIKSVGFEARAEDYERSNVEINYHDGCLRVEIEAGDLNALRAALNSHLRWIATSLKLIQA